MNIKPFSKHVFWSYKPNADLAENLVVQHVIAYGEISDFRLISELLSPEKINSAIENWQNKKQYAKHINFLRQVFLDV